MKRFLRLIVVTAGFIVFGSAAYAQVSHTGTLVAINTTYGTASSNTSFDMSGSNTGNIIVTPPAGFEVSLTAVGGFTSGGLTVVRTSGNATTGDLTATTIYVRIPATTVPGTYSGNIVCNPASGGNHNVATASSVVAVKPLTITGATASNKPYDGTNVATMGGSPVLAGGLEGSDVVTVGGTPAGTFSQTGFGAGLTVTATGYALAGAQAARYSVSQPTGITADITKKGLTITGVGVANRPYDQTLAATITGTPSPVGVVGAEVVTITGSPTATFATATAGVGKTVTFTGYTIGGADVANYTLSAQPTTTADITQIPLTVTGLTGSNKVYDATLTASFTGTAALSAGVLAPDVVSLGGSGSASFVTKVIGTAKTINVTGFTLGGVDGGNYLLTQPTLSGDITAAALTITGVTANNKGYDATNVATLSGTPTPVGVLGSDVVTIVGPPTATFATNGPGVGIAVTVTGYTLGGADGGNYTVSQPTGLTATIFGNTDVVQVTGGVVVGPTVNTSLGNVALLGFSLNNPGTTSNFQSISFTTSSNPSLLFNTITLVSSTDAIYDAGDPAVTATVNTTATSIDVTGITGQTITGGATVYYYFLKVALKPALASANPTILISFTPATNMTFSAGVGAQGVAVNTINGGNSAYTIHDNIAPSIVSITNTLPVIYQGALTQTVTVVFSEKMDNSVNPVITVSSGTWGAQAAGSWNSPTDDTYTTTFTHGASPEETSPGVTTNITALTPKDIANNTIAAGASSTGFLLDNRKPIAAVTTIISAPSIVTTNNLTGLQIRVTYDEPMNPSAGARPTISLIGATNFNALPAGVWTVGNTVYTVNATHNGTAEELTGVTAQSVGGQDVAGNIPLTDASPGFNIDTRRPTFTSITRATAQFTSDTFVDFIITFQDVVNIDVADLQLVPSGTVTFTPITPASITTSDNKVYTVSVTGISGDGDLRLDINAGATITDVPAGNFLIVPGVGIPGQFYSLDHTPPTVVSMLLAPGFKETFTSAAVSGVIPASHSNTIDYIITFSEPVNGLTSADITNNTAGPITTTPTVTPETPAPTTQWRISYPYISGTGAYRSNFVRSTTLVQDQALNLTSTVSFFTGTICYVLPGQPSGPVASLTPSPLPTSVTVTWTDVVAPVVPTNYLVVLRTTGTQSVVDGGYVADDSNLADGIMTLNVAQGVQSANFAGIPVGTQYHVSIYPYTLAPNTIVAGTDRTAIDYNTTTPARVSRASDIITDAAFPYTNNIAYGTANNQLGAITLNTHGTAMERFIVRDGGGIADDDNLGTQLGSITLKITNYQYLRRVALINANTGLVVQDRAIAPVINVSGNTGELVFNTFANQFIVGDDGTNNLIVRATFIGAGVIDNSVVSFQVTGITSLTGAGTSLFSNYTPTGILGTNTVDENKIEVTATQLDFVTMPTSITINTNFGPVVVQARDVLTNVDLDFISPVSAFSNTDALTMANTPFTPDPIRSFATTPGTLTFPANFQFTSSPASPPTQLSISAGGLNNQLSPNINITASQESVLAYLPSFPSRLNYLGMQATDIALDANSIAIATFQLSDGVIGTPDIDGAPTTIKSITLDITTTDALGATVAGAKGIRNIALYNQAGTELGEQTLGSATSVTFNIASLFITAPDNGTTTFTLRASFKDGAANIADRDNIQLKITNVVQDLGSGFNPVSSVTSGSWNAGTGAVTSASITPNNVNVINVIASKLDFMTPQIPPPALVGVSMPVALGIVEAHNQTGLLDTEFNFPASVTSGVGVSGSFAFSAGSLNLSSLEYSNAGDGTLLVSAAGITSNMNDIVSTPNNVSVQCTPITVLHVTTTIATGGVSTTTNLVGNSTDKVIFGFGFNVLVKVGTEPLLSRFTISFNNPIAAPITGIFSSFKVYESTSASFNTATSTDVTLFGAILTPNAQTLVVDFPVKRDIATVPVYYFLMVNIDPTASGSTPAIQPSVVDGGFGTGTQDNILTTYGSQLASTFGQTYTFASIFPPILTSSSPGKAQLNADPTKNTIDLKFSVPVWSLDKYVLLYDYDTDALIDTCKLIGPLGIYNPAGTGTADTIKFQIPASKLPLQNNHFYYVTIPTGNFAGLTGIMDAANNVFLGFSDKGSLYFKTTTTTPPILLSAGSTIVAPNPKVESISLAGAIVTATFDQRGTAYFMVVNQGGPQPTNDQIQGLPAPAYGGIIRSRGKIDIKQTYPISQSGLAVPIGGSWPANPYDVWMFAKNDGQPSGFATAAPYGSSAFNFNVIGSSPGITGPTLAFTASNATSSTMLNKPDLTICNNSYQIINTPITISEYGVSQFNGVGLQTFNIVLPAGFQFDVSKTGSVPSYGTLTLTGNDFQASSGVLDFFGNSILTVSFINTGNSTFDRISISGLRVIATASSSGPLKRLGGNALTGLLVDGAIMGTLTSSDAAAISFTNSYHKSLTPPPTSIVTAIPDNFNSPDLKVLLEPKTAAGGDLFASGDYGPSTFTGQGVNVTTLSLNAVTLDAPFNITISHTDNNGCVSNNPVQYTVYNHTTGINFSTSAPTAGPGVFPPAPLPGTLIKGPYCVTGTIRHAVYNNVAGYNMRDPSDPANNFRADLPQSVIAAAPYPAPGAQVMSGTLWQGLIKSLPEAHPFTVGASNLVNYTFDDTKILNANVIPGIPDPKLVFQRGPTAQGHIYNDGGSLGIIEFTGTYQSTTNSTVVFPRKQVVEFFVPPVPLVEVDLANSSTPVVAQAVPIYCEGSGLIKFNGFPAALPGTSVGTFTIADAATGLVDLDNPSITDDFVANSNGTATLDPTKVNIAYRYTDIRVTYSYKLDRSPCGGVASITIRIAPNPIGRFSKHVFNTSDPQTPFATSLCVGKVIEFDAGTAPNNSTIATGTIDSYAWDYNDVFDVTPGTGILSQHTFNKVGPYAPILTVKSTMGCFSTPVSQSMNIGGIPIAKFKVEGVSTNDEFHFNSNDTAVPFGASAPFTPTGNIAANNTKVDGLATDVISKYVWDFGDSFTATVDRPADVADDAGFNSHVVSHTYAVTAIGRKDINLTVTSAIGCVNSLALQNTYRSIVVLPRQSLTLDPAFPMLTGTLDERFEGPEGAKWQVWGAGTSVETIKAGQAIATWALGAPQAGLANPMEPLLTGSKVWKTNLTGNYTKGEKSALYSPSMDLSSLTRPMISFNSLVQLEVSDGVVLEYSKDNLNIADHNKEWKVLGVVGDGEDWFTNQGIAGRPGSQTGNDFGWSGTGIQKWQSSKHVADSAVGTKIVFRWALGSAATVVTSKGFALDNVRIGDRTRTILLESFMSTSNSSPVEKIQNDYVGQFQSASIGTEVVKLNYHLGFPAKDPFNEDNPADPSSRALLYNITSTPKSLLDGEKDAQDRNVTSWIDDLYNLRTLQLAQADIEISYVVNNGVYNISVKVTSTVVSGIPAATMLHVAILEQSIPLGSLTSAQQAMVKSGENKFDFVVKKMLPSAAGTRFSQLLPNSQTRTFNFTWMPDPKKSFAPTGDLAIAAFVQQESAPYEIYQVEVLKAGIPEPIVITGLEPVLADAIIVFPIPSNQEMNIALPGQLAEKANVQLIDQIGRVVHTSSIDAGATSKVISTHDLAAGVYILQLEIGTGNFTRKKIVIAH